MNHLDELSINAIADGEQTDDHVRQCAQCAAAVVDVMQMKRAVRALPRFDVGRVLNPSAARRAAAGAAADGLRTRPTSRTCSGRALGHSSRCRTSAVGTLAAKSNSSA